MRYLLLLSFALLAACSLAPSPDSIRVASATPSAASATATPLPLTISISPDGNPSFSSVIGTAPFTVTIDVQVRGGTGPTVQSLSLTGTGLSKPTTITPGQPFVFPAGEYTVTAAAQDNGGSAQATRRIVALGARPAAPGWKYGVTAHLQERRAGYYPTIGDVARATDLVSRAGIQTVRLYFNWDKFSVGGPLNFDDYDAMLSKVRDSGRGVLGVLAFSSWAGSSATQSNDWRVRLYSPPRDPHEFAQFAFQVVSRYRNVVRAWQVWDEPNVAQYWQPAPDAAKYVALLKETYLAIKYADPSATVVFGGLSGNGVEGNDQSGWESNFIQAAYSAGAKGYFDVMAIQPYMLPNSGIATVRGRIDAARAVMNKNGDANLPIWLTEIGVPTDAAWWPTSPLQSEGDQANWLTQVFTKLWDQTSTIFWYSLQDRPKDTSADAHFGLLRSDFSPKPAYDRLKTLIAAQ